MFMMWSAVGFAWLLKLIINVQGEIWWEVEKPVSRYGQELVLYCIVGRCCINQAGWSKNVESIFLDVRVLSTSPYDKYDGLVNRTGFSLIIRNLTEMDLNQSYSCSHGFFQSKAKVLNVRNAFVDPGRHVHVSRIIEDDKEKVGNNLTIIVIIPGIAAGFIITTAILYWHIKKRKAPDLFQNYIKIWEEDGKCKGSIDSKKLVEFILEKNSVAVVTKKDGSALIHSAALGLHRKHKYEIIPYVNDPDQLEVYYDKKKKQVFVIDDYDYNNESMKKCNKEPMNKWVKYDEHASKILKKDQTAKHRHKLLVSCNPEVFEDIKSLNTFNKAEFVQNETNSKQNINCPEER